MTLLSSGDFVTNLENYIDAIGIPGNFGLIFVALVFLVGVIVALFMLEVPRMVVLLAGVTLLMMFTAFGWFPVWIVIVIAVAVFGMFLMSVLGGAR